MADREKVIKGIECCKEACGAGNCPYWNGSMIDGSCMLKLHADALALLKEHEAKMKHCNDIALEYAKEVFRLQTLLKEQPEIVRCKDCSNWIPGYITDDDDFIPPKCGKYQQMVGHSADDYCSLAERE